MPPTPIPIRRLAELAAERTLRTLVRGSQVAKFVQEYARTNERQAVVSSLAQVRSLNSALTREALLFLAWSLENELSRRIVPASSKPVPGHAPSGRAKGSPSARETRAIAQFRAYLLEALAWEAKWKPEESASFRYDLELYWKLAPAKSAPARASNRRPGAPSGPFVDRCSILLDPSFFDLARKAAAAFQLHLEAQAVKSLKATLAYLAT